MDAVNVSNTQALLLTEKMSSDFAFNIFDLAFRECLKAAVACLSLQLPLLQSHMILKAACNFINAILKARSFRRRRPDSFSALSRSSETLYLFHHTR